MKLSRIAMGILAMTLLLLPLACKPTVLSVPRQATASNDLSLTETPVTAALETPVPTHTPLVPVEATATETPVWTWIPVETWGPTFVTTWPILATPTPYVPAPCSAITSRALTAAYPCVSGYHLAVSQADVDALWAESFLQLATPVPPEVDFATERIASHSIISMNGCVSRYSLLGVCEEADRIVVREQEVSEMPRAFQCGPIYCTQAIVEQSVVAVVPKSAKPVVWQITRLDYYGDGCVRLTEPVTTIYEPWLGDPTPTPAP